MLVETEINPFKSPHDRFRPRVPNLKAANIFSNSTGSLLTASGNALLPATSPTRLHLIQRTKFRIKPPPTAFQKNQSDHNPGLLRQQQQQPAAASHLLLRLRIRILVPQTGQRNRIKPPRHVSEQESKPGRFNLLLVQQLPAPPDFNQNFLPSY